MKATIDTQTGLMIESQSDSADDAALIANANSAGFMNVKIISVTDAELTALIDARTPISMRISEAINKTYGDVDSIYALAIGNRGEEYKQAESDARAFKAAGYSGAVSPYIAGWASVKSLTNQQSADAIIARADALAAAKLSMRNQRFTSQAAMQNAADQAQLDVAVGEWKTFIASIRSALGL